MIYVTLGTMFLGFDRLVEAVDSIAETSGEQVIVQTGLSQERPRHCAWFDFLPHEDVLAIQRHARVIVGHAGIGTVLDALAVKRPLIVVPRLKRYGEHMNDHQMEIAEAVARRAEADGAGCGGLADACARPPAAPVDYRLIKGRWSSKHSMAGARCGGVGGTLRGVAPTFFWSRSRGAVLAGLWASCSRHTKAMGRHRVARRFWGGLWDSERALAFQGSVGAIPCANSLFAVRWRGIMRREWRL